MTVEGRKSFVDRICGLSESLIAQDPIERVVLKHSILSSKLDETNGRHAHQQASLLGHIERIGCLDKSNVFLELGAGKAALSHYMHLAVGDPSRFILLDRKASRLKVNRLKEDISPAGTWNRVHMDLKDFDLTRHPLTSAKDEQFTGIFAYSKHLCGVATDLGLRCLANYDADKSLLGLRGIVIALCCHHVCSYREYINHEFLSRTGISAQEFAILKSLSSWATSGFRAWEAAVAEGGEGTEALPSKEKEVTEETATGFGFPYAERVVVGRACKNVLNFGRLRFAQSLGLDCRLVEYVDQQHTLENIALVATRPKE
ncbi:hypothetical protein HDU67_009994 [Dinochytrium kinnereticum]|nr:hypothetical protein HDU67_009994 [Dinochytrium kinnereticum]